MPNVNVPNLNVPNLNDPTAVSELHTQNATSVRIPTTAGTLLAEALCVGRQFFLDDSKRRERLACPTGAMSGWRPIGVEYSKSPDRPDLNETFCYRRADAHRHNVRDKLLDAAAACQAALDGVAANVLSDLAEELDVDVPSIRTINESWLQFNWSRPSSLGRDFIQDAHEDGHLLTFLAADAPGLDVVIAGRWTSVLPSAQEPICFAGECGALLTDDYVTPAIHRVQARADVETRLSIAYFVNPDLDQELKPWRDGPRNQHVDLLRWGQQNPARFGLPVL